MRRKFMRNLMKPLLSLKTKKGYSIFSVVVVALFSVWVISDALKSEVVIAADGETHVVKTSHQTVGDLLKEMGITVKEHDHVSHPGKAEIKDGMEIFYKTANKINLTIDEETNKFFTTADTVKQFLEENDLSLSEHDDISHELTYQIEDDLNITVNKAFEVVIDNGGKKSEVWTTGGTVEQILADEEVTYDELDRITPSLKERLTKDNAEIEVVNVELKTETVEEKLAFETEKKQDNSLEKGKQKTISAGKDGLVKKTYEVTYENGEEADRQLIKEDVKEKSKNKVVAVGTKQVQQQTVATNSGNRKSNQSSSPSGGKELVMQATAYTAGCNGCSGYTATGINLNSNPNAKVIAVDPNVIPLGSKVWVEGYGTAIAGDTGGSINGNRIDAHVPTQGDAQKFGRRTVRVKVLD